MDQKKSSSQGAGDASKESKLDQWFKKNFMSGDQPASKEIVHLKNNNKPHNKKKKTIKKKRYNPKSDKTNQRVKEYPEKAKSNFLGGYFSSKKYKGKLRVIPLGGLNEVGKNCMALEYGEDIIIIDLGLQFPEEDMLGVDYVIPDIGYLEEKKDNIRGIIFTHGHLDHIGAVPYLLPKLNYPQMYGLQLTMSLIQHKLEDHGMQASARSNIVTLKDNLQLGPFNISFFGVNHSIPDSMGVVVKTPAGNIVHTGDFKFDMTPSGLQKPAEFDKISQLQHQDIAALFIDSTNALKPGHTITEQRIGQSLENIVKNCPGRIIIASFASQIGRLQQIIDIAMKCDRKVVLSGRSLVENFIISKRIGYLHVPQDTVFEAKKAHRFPDEKTIILTTGSQGENVAALSRMALQEHPKIKIKKGDTVIMSSSPIPGNERAIFNVMNNLTRLGARVIDNKIMDVHASGHGQEEDVKLMISFVKPKNVVPIHGEYFMRTGCGEIAKGMGYTDDQVVMLENGHVIEIENGNAVSKKEIIPNRYVLVDGYGVDDVSANVIMDRQKLSENGVIVLLFTVNQKTKKLLDEVNIISRGFIYMKESEKLVKEITDASQNAYRKIIEKRPDAKRQEVKKYIQETVDRHIHDKLNRQPLILPVFFEK